MDYWELFVHIVKYGFPSVALFLSILSFINSRRANNMQMRVNKLEERLKEIELAEKEKELEEANKACVETRIVNISQGKYRLKVWNSGKAKAYEVDLRVQEIAQGLIRRDKVPYEYLEPGKNFEELIYRSMGTADKFEIETVWKNEAGEEFSKKQMVSF